MFQFQAFCQSEEGEDEDEVVMAAQSACLDSRTVVVVVVVVVEILSASEIATANAYFSPHRTSHSHTRPASHHLCLLRLPRDFRMLSSGIRTNAGRFHSLLS